MVGTLAASITGALPGSTLGPSGSEGLLRQGPAGAGQGFTAQARELLGRTALSGEVRLGELVGRAEGRNTVRLHSESVGRGLGADALGLAAQRRPRLMPSSTVRDCTATSTTSPSSCTYSY